MHWREDGLSSRSCPSITNIARDEWDKLFPHPAQSWAFYRACELAPPNGFKLDAAAVYNRGSLVAAAPVFATRFRLDMPFRDGTRSIISQLSRHIPNLGSVPLIGLGSPILDRCDLGFAKEVRGSDRCGAFASLLDTLRSRAADTGARVLALKDIADDDTRWADAPLSEAGYTRIPSLPRCVLELPFANANDYLESLSSSMRSDLRRKMRQASDVQCGVTDSVEGIEDDLFQLYEEQRERSAGNYNNFDSLSPAYFREVIGGLKGQARLMTCRVDGKLASFNLFIAGADRAVAHKIGLRNSLVRANNLYFVNWMMMVIYCIHHRIPLLELGQTSYALKKRLGCKIERSWTYFRHRYGTLNQFFKILGPYAAFDRAV